MRVAITGSRGLLGSSLKNKFKKEGIEVIEINRPDYDIVSYESLIDLPESNTIDFLINCAAYTNVPKAQEEPDLAFLTNLQGVTNLSKFCLHRDIHFIHFSTDFVFDGYSKVPYLESDAPNPLNIYGMTKLESEIFLKKYAEEYSKFNYTVFRVQWLYGNNLNNFFQKIYQAYKNNNKISLVDDEFGCPTHVDFLSNILFDILNSSEKNELVKNELFHLTHDDFSSRYDCGSYFLKELGCLNIEKVSNLRQGELRRPKYGVLDNTKLRKVLGYSLGSWKDCLNSYINLSKEGNL